MTLFQNMTLYIPMCYGLYTIKGLPIKVLSTKQENVFQNVMVNYHALYPVAVFALINNHCKILQIYRNCIFSG